MREKNAPKLRFKGFFEDWEQRKFNNLVVRVNKITNSNSLPKIEFEDILAGEGRLNKDVSQKFDNRKGVEFLPNDILYGKLRPYLKNWLKPSFTGVALGDFWVFRVIKSDSDFIYSLIQSDKYQRVANDTSGTKMPRSDWKKVSETEFLVPDNRNEQQKIGNFFKQLDDTIALHQRKIDSLKLLKHAFLQKMLVNQGFFPEVRFADFDEKWEQRKLGDLGTVAMNKRIFKKETSERGDIPFYKIGTFGSVPDSFISRRLFDEYKEKYPYPEKGDLLISASGSIGRVVEYTGADEYFQDSNIVWLKHDNQLVNSFLKQFYNIVKWHGLEGSTIKRLYNKNILETEIGLPSRDEQQKIGYFFKQLDDTIALHQNKLDNFKQLKKSFSQKIFI
ncbi:type I restriction enzyme, S subunit [Enterococcus sp. DIV1767]|uniref:restriction endonuclease subunit S n=1 Tax=Enterococcus sp. DIV1767 TaxID=2774670 RepID=UPI003D2FAE5E